MGDREMRERGGVSVRAHSAGTRAFVNEAVRWRVIVEGLTALMETAPFTEKGLYTSLAELYLYAEQRRREVVAELAMGQEQRELFEDAGPGK